MITKCARERESKRDGPEGEGKRGEKERGCQCHLRCELTHVCTIQTYTVDDNKAPDTLCNSQPMPRKVLTQRLCPSASLDTHA
jgi:hypothetical protein